MKSAFLTLGYKGAYIQTCYDCRTGSEEIQVNHVVGGRRVIVPANSVPHAKSLITRNINKSTSSKG